MSLAPATLADVVRRRRRDATITQENDAWVPVYQANAWQLSEVLPPSEETAPALVALDRIAEAWPVTQEAEGLR